MAFRNEFKPPLKTEAPGPRVSQDDRREFQKLKTALHRRIIDAVDPSKASSLGEAELYEELQALVIHVCSRDAPSLSDPARETMVREILDEIYGFGPLEPLVNDPEVNDILVNGPDSVWVERNGITQETDIRFADEAHLRQLIQRLVGRTGRRIDELSPMVEAMLPDGSRLNAVIPPLAKRGPTLSIRRFKANPMRLEEMVGVGTLAPEMAEFLNAAVETRLNILVSGGSGAGKTTLLNTLARSIPRSERVVTVEETAELRLLQSDVVSLETRPANVDGRGEVNLRDLLKNALRLRPDRVILGELRGAEAIVLLEAMHTGQAGSMTNLHADDMPDALARLELMLALAGAELPVVAARQYIAAAVQILVQIARLSTGERKVMRISELVGYQDGRYQINDIFVCRIAGPDENGRATGTFYATGYEPAALLRQASLGYELRRDLFVARQLGARTQSSASHESESPVKAVRGAGLGRTTLRSAPDTFGYLP